MPYNMTCVCRSTIEKHLDWKFTYLTKFLLSPSLPQVSHCTKTSLTFGLGDKTDSLLGLIIVVGNERGSKSMSDDATNIWVFSADTPSPDGFGIALI